MQEEIFIDDGPSVRIQTRPAQGTRHEVLFGALRETEEPVAVKLERIPGALEREEQALRQLAMDGGPAPRLLAAGATVVDGERLACHRASPWRAADNRERVAANGTGARSCRQAGRTEQPVARPRSAFGQQHAQRLSDLGDRLALLAAAIPDWELLASPEVPRPSPLVLTHGDPGPGNLLDDGRDGTLIDWEEAHVAPRGLDLARLVFIALLGAGPSGFQARDHRSRARSVIDGYLGALEDCWRPSVADARWWTAVAGIQFVHRRWQLGGQPAPWEDAADVLQAALAQGVAWERS